MACAGRRDAGVIRSARRLVGGLVGDLELLEAMKEPLLCHRLARRRLLLMLVLHLGVQPLRAQ